MTCAISPEAAAYLRSLNAKEKDRLAGELGTTRSYIYNLIYGNLRPSIKWALKLQEATDGQLTVQSLRPDLPWPKSEAEAQ